MLVHKGISWEVVVFQGRKIIAKDDKHLRRPPVYPLQFLLQLQFYLCLNQRSFFTEFLNSKP